MVLVMMVMFAGKVWAQTKEIKEQPYIVAKNQTAYAVLKDSVLTFYYVNKLEDYSTEHEKVYVVNFNNESDWTPTWISLGNSKEIKRVVFHISFSAYMPISCYKWFYKCQNLKEFQNIQYLKTNDVVNMAYMFYGCSGLENIDLRNFNTTKVIDMAYMFCGCRSIENIDLSKFNTANVINMEVFFSGCKSLIDLDLSNFNTAKVTNMNLMFAGLQLENINLSTLNTQNVTSMSGMFEGCMRLKELDLSKFNTSRCESMQYMFKGCSSLNSLDLSKFNTGKVQYMGTMFADCKNLVIIYVGDGWTTNNMTDKHDMFKNCNRLYGSHGTSNNDNLYNPARIDEGAPKPGLLSKVGEQQFCPTLAYATLNNGTLTFRFDTKYDNSNAFFVNTYQKYTYKQNRSFVWTDSIEIASAIKEVVFDESFRQYELSSCRRFFENLTNVLVFKNFENLNMSNVTDMSGMFKGCNSLTDLDLSKLNTSNVTDMSMLLWNCEKLCNINFGSFNTSNVTNASHMFYNCKKIKTLDLSNFNTAKVTDMTAMFSSCDSLVTIFVDAGWSTLSIENREMGIFYNCNNLVGGLGTTIHKNRKVDVEYAKIDELLAPGVLTKKGTLPYIKGIAYATLHDGVLTFYYTENKPYGAFEVKNDNKEPGWNKIDYDNKRGNLNIKTVVFDKSFLNYHPDNCYRWFYGLRNLTNIEGIENFNTGRIADFSYMFYGCSRLSNLDLSSLNTSSATDMQFMFYECSNLTSLVLNHFNTSSVTNMNSMFYACTSLTNLDVKCFNTKNVINMGCMFQLCSGLKTLDLSSFNTENVTVMSSHYTDGREAGMFTGCNNLESINLGNFNTKNVIEMYKMFAGCRKLKELDLSSFNTESVRDMTAMFLSCTQLSTIYVSNRWNTDKVVKSGQMFYGCTSIKGGKGTVFNSAWNCNVIMAHADFGEDYPGYMTDRYGNISFILRPYGVKYETRLVIRYDNHANLFPNACASVLTYHDNSGVNTTDLDKKSIYSIDIDESFKNYQPTNCNHWFGGYTNVVSISGLKYMNTANVTDMELMFSGCSKLEELDLSSFKTSKVTNMASMFMNCSSLTSLDLSTFNTEKVESMVEMFRGCSKLKTIDLSSFCTSESSSLASMFSGCSSLVALDLRSFRRGVYSSGYLNYLFCNCKNLELVLISYEWEKPYIYTGTFTNTGKLSGCYYKLTLDNTLKGYATFENNTLTFNVTCSDIPAGSFAVTDGIPTWSDKNLKVEKVIFSPTFKYVHPTTLYGWFFNCRNLTEIEGLEYLNTEDVENMSLMFAGCKNLTSLNLTNFNTQNVTNMKGMFGYYDKDEDKGYYCDKLETIFVGDGWTTKYTEDDKLFEGCKKLVGGLGSTYNEKNVSTDYAHIDGGKSSPGYLTYMPDEAHKTVAAIAMNALPKTEYIQGEPLSTTGGTIKVDYNNMTTDIIDLSNAEITGFDTEKVGNQVLVVTYYDKKTTYEINVKAKTITKLEVTTLPKTEYGIGEKINLDGGVLTVSYSNNLSEKVALSQAKVSGYDPMKLGTQKLSVIYLQNETSFEVKVVEKPAQSIAVTTLPKVLYVEGDAFSAAGGIITITYDGGSKGESNLTNAKLSGFDPNKIGEQTIKVEYLGCETSYKVTVKELAYYNVTYKIDGEIYGEVERVKLGSSITPREAPAKDGYTFSGWSEIPANMPDHDIEIVDSFTKDTTPEDPTTPTSEISINSNVKIWSFDRTIVIENPGHDIQIVDINGRLVKTMKTDDSRIEIPMSAPGIYIVKTVAKTQKVMVK